MHLPLILELARDTMPERLVVDDLRLTDLAERAARAAAWFRSRNVRTVVHCATNGSAFPIALYGSALAGIPFSPVNYRLGDVALRSIVQRTAPAVVITDDTARLAGLDDVDAVSCDDFLAAIENGASDDAWAAGADIDPAAPAIMLFTSGTSGEPKAAVLRHEHLATYILSTVELGASESDEAALVSVPPYHIAGIAAVLSNTYLGRRIVYLSSFDPDDWIEAIVREGVTHAMVVPTMLHRVLDALQRRGESLPGLRHLSYGGGPMPRPVVERALTMLPHVDFVNAYGLTETSSSIAVLGPEDHRLAAASTDPRVQRRLGSVGKPLPTVETSIRNEAGDEVGTGERGIIWVRGPQVSGEYVGLGDRVVDGWFDTRDAGEMDEDGYMYVFGRQDDVIVRGGENLSPGEIEDVLLRHAAVSEAVVVGVPDVDWGETVMAAVVLAPGASVTEEELRDHVRAVLRSARTPERIQFRETLPTTDTGKVLRRTVRADLTELFG